MAHEMSNLNDLTVGTTIRWKTPLFPWGIQYPQGVIVGISRSWRGKKRYVVKYPVINDWGHRYTKTKAINPNRIVALY